MMMMMMMMYGMQAPAAVRVLLAQTAILLYLYIYH